MFVLFCFRGLRPDQVSPSSNFLQPQEYCECSSLNSEMKCTILKTHFNSFNSLHGRILYCKKKAKRHLEERRSVCPSSMSLMNFSQWMKQN